MTGKEPTSKISKVKNETTFILGIKLSFEVAPGHEQDILCASFVSSRTSSRVLLLLLLKETR